MSPRLQNVLLLLLSTLLSLILVEGILRAVEDGRPWKRKFSQPGRLSQQPPWVHDPHVGARFRPEWTGLYSFHADWPPTPIDANRWGFRSPDVDEKKPPGRRRVALIGDSLVAALQVADDAHFRARLEAALNSEVASEGGGAEVLGFGIPGTGPVAHLSMYLHHARRFAPDAVVLGIYTPNDFTDNAAIRWRRDDGSLVERPFVDAPGDLRKWVKANSALAMASWYLVSQRGRTPRTVAETSGEPVDVPVQELGPHELAPYELAEVSERDYGNALDAWRTLVEHLDADGVACRVVLFPTEVVHTEAGWMSSARQRALHRVLEWELEALGAEVLTGAELLEHHQRRVGSSAWAKVGDYLSEEGHASLADLLTEGFVEGFALDAP